MAARLTTPKNPSVSYAGPHPWESQSPHDSAVYETVAALDDRRVCTRRSLRCLMQMIDVSLDPVAQESRTVPAECLNISDWGLYGTVGIGYGVAIGQRYVFRLRFKGLGPEPGLVQVVSQEGIIVRTELILGQEGDRVGFSVRLCGHRAGMVPMPGR